MKKILAVSFLLVFLNSFQLYSQVIAGGNNEFENDFSGWTRLRDWWDSSTNIIINTTNPYSGLKDAKCNGHAELYNQLYTNITGLSVSTNYELNFYAKGGKADFYVGPVENVYPGTYKYINTGESYTMQSVNFTATATTMRLWFDLYPNNELFVDSFICNSSTLSMDNHNSEFNLIKIHPNPAIEKITIVGNETELNQLNIFDLLGRNLTKTLISTRKSRNELVINLSELKTGVYFIKTKTTTNKVYKK
ncbi:T9SS type A sorting domain-containing protein [Bacteroidota bacterium]